MQNRPPLWNGIEVPYGLSINELAHIADGPAPFRWAAFVALAYTAGDAALLALRKRTESADPYTRRMALECIGIREDAYRVADAICGLLLDVSGFVVRTACDVVAQHRISESYDSVIRLLESEDPSTREAALRAVGVLWKDSALESIIRIFRTDTSISVRKQAGWTLRSVACIKNWDALFELWRIDTQPRHKQWACELARDFGAPSVIAALELLTRDQDGHVRDKAFAAIEQIQCRFAALPNS